MPGKDFSAINHFPREDSCNFMYGKVVSIYTAEYAFTLSNQWATPREF